jgi:hypothetical protein
MRLASGAIAFVVLLLVGKLLVTSETVIEWYAEFAFHNLPAMFTSVGPGESERGAYFFCVKSVAREVRSAESVTTFSSITESELRFIPERTYQVHSSFDQSFEEGPTVVREFHCQARYDRGKWVLDTLDVEPLSGSAQANARR